MKPNATFDQIGDILRSKKRFAVMSHMRPDGDALGCTLAMALCLRQLGKEVTAWNEDGVPEKFRYLPEWQFVTTPSAEPQDFDAVIVLDNAVRERVGTPLKSVRNADVWINIDHHVSNDRFADLNYVDATAPATGQILFDLFERENLPITYTMADNLFVAISTDTGSFQYPSTTARTFEVGAALARKGVNVGALSRAMYESHPRRRIELLRACLERMKFTAADRVASFSLPLATAQAIGAQPEDNEGLIDHIRAVEGVVAAAFFEELPDGKIRVSLRSKDPRVDVSIICGMFGGGGHILAAGARIKTTLADAETRVLAALGEAAAQI